MPLISFDLEDFHVNLLLPPTIRLFLYGHYNETETSNENFKALSDLGSSAKHAQFKKNTQS